MGKLPDRLKAGLQFLVLTMLVRIQLGQQKPLYKTEVLPLDDRAFFILVYKGNNLINSLQIFFNFFSNFFNPPEKSDNVNVLFRNTANYNK